MTTGLGVLTAAVSVLFIRVLWTHSYRERPAFAVYFAAYLLNCLLYSDISRAQFVWAAIAMDALRVALIGESFWIVWRKIEACWWALSASVGVAGIIALIVSALDYRFGFGIHAVTVIDASTFALWLTLLLIAARCAWIGGFDLILLGWLAIAPAGDLAFWFTATKANTHGSALNQELNAGAMLLRAGLAVAWAFALRARVSATEAR